MSDVELVLMDWAGTVTVPMREMMAEAVRHLGWADDEVGQALAGLRDYFSSDDSIVHRAERGQIDDRELLTWLDQQYPGSSALFALDQPSFINAPDRPEMIETLWWLQDNEVEVWLATNNFASAQEMLASRYLDPGLVNAIVNSALIGARKPEPAYWDIVLETSGLAPSEVLLVDDNEKNTAAGAELGMATILVGDDIAPAIAELRARCSR